jgi:hypothetical protein
MLEKIQLGYACCRKVAVIKFPQRLSRHRCEVLGVSPSRIALNETVNLILKKKDSSIQIFGNA